MKKNYNLLIGIGLLVLSHESCSQQRGEFYNESNYVYSRKGWDQDYPYIITFLNKSDTNWSLKKVYFDSGYSKIISSTFFYKNIGNGPFVTYVNDKIYRQGYYNEGKWDGERITYTEGVITQKAFFNKGVKIGAWIEYDVKGKITRKTIYDDKGNITQDISY